ncbi:SICAvar type I [Plasmodium knowlesi]|nr:SICAvar type I [Plasmodium knowlesi]
MVAGATPSAAASNSCPSALGETEKQESEATRKQLKAEWDKKLEELRQQWEQQQNAATSSARGTVQPVQGVTIPVPVKTEVEEMLKDLGPYVKWGEASSSAAKACGELRAPGEEKGGGKQTGNMKNVCKVFVQTVNWMGNLKKDGTEKNGGTKEEDWKQYLRCAVGYEVLLRVLLPKYEVEKFMKVISDTMKAGGTQPTESGVTNICSWVKMKDAKDMQALIGDEVQGWLNEAKEDEKKGGIRGFKNVIAWSRYTNETEEQQARAKQKAKPSCQSDSIIDLMKGGRAHQLDVLVNPLTAAEDCIQQKKKDGTTEKSLCDRLKCIDDYLKSQNKTTPPGGSPGGPQTGTGQPSATKDFWEDNGAVKTLWTELSTAMTANLKNGSGTDCDRVKDTNNSGNDRTATHSEKTACKYLHAGFKQLYDPTTPSPSSSDDGILSKNNPSFRQTMGCFLLHSYAKYMQKNAICNIDKGIEEAFKLGKNLSTNGANCNTSSGKGQCVPCHWNDTSMDSCTVQTGTQEAGIPGDKVQSIFKNDQTNIPKMLTEINKMETLCSRLQCIASHLNPSSGQGHGGTSEEEFWKDYNGEVAELWQEFAQAMAQSGGHSNADQCNTVDNGTGGATGRTPTIPEKRACQNLTLGFEKLKQLSQSAASQRNNSKILDKDPSFVQTMGCLFLKEYAKHMKEKSTCVIDSGIEKAFEAWNEKKGTSCTNGSPCIDCKWNENLDNCKINTTNAASKETTQTPLTEKLTLVKGRIEGTASTIMNDINITKSLCQQLQCAAGKWFEKHSKDNSGTATPKKSWVSITTIIYIPMFKEIESEGQKNSTNTNDVVCKEFGDGNPLSVERKACNHITAGLDYIKKIPNGATANPSNGKDNPLLDRAVGCFALNMYADKIIEKSKDTCPIDDKKIEGMFKKWNDEKNNNSCKGSGNNNDCFECQRQPKFNGCQLSVDSSLVNTSTSPPNESCTDQKDKDKVQSEMSKLLNDNSTIHMEEKVSKITNITTSSLCTQLQCAAKKWGNPNSNISSNGEVSWNQFWTKTGEVANLWKDLSSAMTINENDAGDCRTVDSGRSATNPERKACQHLTTGFNKLKENLTNGTSTYPILSKDPSLRQTVGCFLLKEYAKEMKDTSTCVIDSGLKKAFNSWNKNINDKCTGGSPCIQCNWDDNTFQSCEINTTDASGITTKETADKKLDKVKPQITDTATNTLPKINEMKNLCEYIRCAGPKWFKNKNGTSGNSKQTWCDFWDKDGVKPELERMFKQIESDGKTKKNVVCQNFGDGNTDSVERKACNHITAGLDYIKLIPNGATSTQTVHQDDDNFFKQSMMCAALNLYATKIRDDLADKCPIDETRIEQMFNNWYAKNKKSSCPTSGVSVSGGNSNNCFKCERYEDFKNCNLLVDEDLIGTSTPSQPNANCNDNEENKKVQTQMNNLLQADPKMEPTLNEINEMKSSFCTQVQCAIKKKLKIKSGKPLSNGKPPSWNALSDDIENELKALLKNMTEGQSQSDLLTYCDKDAEWNQIGHKQSRTNKAACLLFAAGLKHIYGRPNGQKNGQFKGPSFGQTMGCLFLKEYAKQLKKMAEDKKKGHSWVHPHCSIEDGITYAFGKSEDIMRSVLDECSNGPNGTSCFVCTQNENDYKDCSIGNDEVKTKVEPLLKEKSDSMQETLENTVCPILLTDLLTPFLPLAPVSIGLSAMAYYLWKYFGPLGKGGSRFRRAPLRIPGPSVQEQVLDHVEEAGSHEYRLVKERKPRSAPTRTKRSGPVNRRTIIEIHFEVLDECQKGDTQLNQKDFMELLVQEFMGSELMEEEQVPKEEVLIEEVPMENVPMERVPSLCSGFMI